ncbi:MAG: four helix bundle protein [Bacteroidetes bacterium]|nr:four helix bundle protein [Bacteroidota bacterium]
MTAFKSFEEIISWQKARVLCKEIYVLSSNNKFAKDFGLRDQIRRSAVSVMANIAEGYERKSDGDFKRFLNISKGSLAEVKSHLYIALDLEYITDDKFKKLASEIDEINKTLYGLINYLKQ